MSTAVVESIRVPFTVQTLRFQEEAYRDVPGFPLNHVLPLPLLVKKIIYREWQQLPRGFACLMFSFLPGRKL